MNILCFIGIHRWLYSKNEYGRDVRSCACCTEKQVQIWGLGVMGDWVPWGMP